METEPPAPDSRPSSDSVPFDGASADHANFGLDDLTSATPTVRANLRNPHTRRAAFGLLFVVAVFVVIPVVAMLLAGR